MEPITELTGEKEPHIFACNSRISRSIFVILIPMKIEMNTTQLHMITYLNAS